MPSGSGFNNPLYCEQRNEDWHHNVICPVKVSLICRSRQFFSEVLSNRSYILFL